MTKYILWVLVIFSCQTNTKEVLKKKKTELQQQLKNISKELKLIELQLDSSLVQDDLNYVGIIKLQPQEFNHFFFVHGEVVYKKNIIICSERGGKILKIHVKEGQKVKQGEILININDETNANIKNIKSNLELANILYDKHKKLWNQGIGSELSFLEAKTKKTSLEAQLESLQKDFEKSIIKAPFSGIIDEIFCKEGEMLSLQNQVLRLINPKEVYIKTNIPDFYKEHISIKSPVWYTSKLNGMFDKMGQVFFISQNINPSNRSFMVYINPYLEKNSKANLNSNEVINLKFNDFNQQKALVVPSEAIQIDVNGLSYIFTVDEFDSTNKTAIVRKKIIKTTRSYKGQTLIDSGLITGEKIVIQGIGLIQDKEKVFVTDSLVSYY